MLLYQRCNAPGKCASAGCHKRTCLSSMRRARCMPEDLSEGRIGSALTCVEPTSAGAQPVPPPVPNPSPPASQGSWSMAFTHCSACAVGAAGSVGTSTAWTRGTAVQMVENGLSTINKHLTITIHAGLSCSSIQPAFLHEPHCTGGESPFPEQFPSPKSADSAAAAPQGACPAVSVPAPAQLCGAACAENPGHTIWHSVRRSVLRSVRLLHLRLLFGASAARCSTFNYTWSRYNTNDKDDPRSRTTLPSKVFRQAEAHVPQGNRAPECHEVPVV